MMKNRTLVATYAERGQAELTIQKLTELGFDRQDIGLAVSGDETADDAEALVSVTMDVSQVEGSRQILNTYKPVKIDEREAQWQQGDSTDSANEPDESNFTAPKRTDGQA